MAQEATVPVYQLLWAKTGGQEGQTHPLVCHMLDVAQVTQALWRLGFTDSTREHLAGGLGLDEAAAAQLLAFWAALHDLGKACPAFQRRWQPERVRLESAGLDFPKKYSADAFYHGAATARLLPGLLESETGVRGRLARSVGRALGGHHGAWPVPFAVQSLKTHDLGDGMWDAVRLELVRAVLRTLNPPRLDGLPVSGENLNVLLTLLSGLASVADWVGSMEQHFHFAERPVRLAEYAAHASDVAAQALHQLHWDGWQPPSQECTFNALFGLGEPRPVQVYAMQLASRLTRPALVIIEAPTGVGKTEAALYLADHWARTLRQQGLYVAMPTTATSNQMFDRVRRMVQRRFPGQRIEPLLVHGQAQWVRGTEPPRVNMAASDESALTEEPEVMGWFLPRKRSLLAPLGVGTVDQGLLSVLQTRHFFVRLLGLSHKTVVFDEVHAYDTYMSTLLRRLLGWLRAVGSSVVLLSATLPSKTRTGLLAAYAGPSVASMPQATYPAITWAMEGQTGWVPIEAPEQRQVALSWVERSDQAIVDALRSALREGGVAAVICNTVRRAQALYQALLTAGVVPEEELVLFHARFPLAWREQVERRVLMRCGKESSPDARRKAVVVATQVIEQSLDLDFDFMMSELAPVDLIIQRAGRLHRHAHRTRPSPLGAPRLMLVAPEMDRGIPRFGADAFVYEPYVLLRSYLVLQGRQRLALPDDTSSLIEAVYGDAELNSGGLGAELAKAYAKMDANQVADMHLAEQRLVGAPSDSDLLSLAVAGLVEDDPEVHRTLQALTRLGPPSVSVACLHRVGTGLNTEPDGAGRWVHIDRKPDAEMTHALVRTAVDVSDRRVFDYLVGQPAPPAWADHPLLKRFRLLVFEDGACSMPGLRHTFRLTRSLGLQVLEPTEPQEL